MASSFSNGIIAPSQLLTLALLSCVSYVCFLLLQARQKRIAFNVPDVKGGLPFFGVVFNMLKGSPWDTMANWAKEYGSIYSFHLFGSDSLCVSDPNLLKYILNTKMSIFKKDLDWVYRPFLVILGNGLVTAHGDSWRKQRNLLSHTLRIDILDEIPAMALRAVQRLSKKIDASIAAGTTINMAEEFRHLTLQVIAEAILSLSPEESDETFAHMYLPIVEEGNLRTWHPERTFMPFLPAYWEYHASVKKLNGYVSGLINARRALRRVEAARPEAGMTSSPVPRKQDVLDKVLQAAPSDADWTEASLQQVCDEVKTFILAGHETSASMLTWSLYELSQNQTLRDKLRQQADDVYGPVKSPIARATIPPKDILTAKLDYADCCLRESLRKYSVVPSVVRVCSEPLVYEKHNIHIPRGTNVMINIQGAHWNEENWPEPATYRPERFYETIKPYTFLPFVDGPRMCLGQFLSLLESKIVLSLLVQAYDFEVVNTEDAGKTHPFMVPIIPKTGHIMKVTKRY